MPSFGQRFAEGLGQQIVIGRENAAFQADLENKQALAALRRQEVEANAAALAEQKRQQQVSREIGGFLAQAQAADKQEVMDPLKSAKAFNDAATIAYSKGAPDLAVKLENQAKAKTLEAKEMAQTKALEQKQKAETLADTATNFLNSPSPEGASELAKAAVAAGQNPMQIPAPGTPAFARWAKQQTMASMSAKEQMAAAEKQREFDAQQERLKKEHEDREEDKRLSRQQVSIAQQGLAEYRKDMIDLKKQMAERAAAKASGGGKLAEDRIDKVNQTSALLAQQFELMGDFGPATALSAFAALKPGSDTSSALAKAGTTTITTSQQQMMAATAANAGSAMARLMQAVEGGRGPTEAAMNKMQEALAPQSGETALTAMFKHLRWSEEVSSMIDHANKRGASEEQLEQLRETKDRYKQPITSRQLLKMVREAGNSEQLEQLMTANGSISSAVTAASESAKANSAKVPASATSAPSGLSPAAAAAWDKY